ncbi:hypothetical protein F5Y00DRAFT_262572 [Daldinia vernicosa]|uniref:uncharacterized protein n=1 Tax=Daldinia vernicosa TaxID=114800 RepID=UPI002008D223|nr:uncharacterized protein F5Y00DRAFT_262572 [Daldinia vernicosa]KAI0848476.1 hypothetical protein F5Y00DRAFT_262572 [Daldinia vernicosa]
MSNFSCGHSLKSRVGANLAHIAQDKRKPCPDCQTRTPGGVLTLLKILQKSCETKKLSDPNIKQYLTTYIFDRFISQRKNTSTGFKQQFDEIFQEWGTATYYILDQKQLSNLSVTIRARWGSDVGRQALRVVAIAALKEYEVFDPIEPADAEILATLNRMIGFMRDRATAVETFDQLEVIFDGAATLGTLRDNVTSALIRLEDGFTKWDAAANK